MIGYFVIEAAPRGEGDTGSKREANSEKERERETSWTGRRVSTTVHRRDADRRRDAFARRSRNFIPTSPSSRFSSSRILVAPPLAT